MCENEVVFDKHQNKGMDTGTIRIAGYRDKCVATTHPKAANGTRPEIQQKKFTKWHNTNYLQIGDYPAMKLAIPTNKAMSVKYQG